MSNFFSANSFVVNKYIGVLILFIFLFMVFCLSFFVLQNPVAQKMCSTIPLQDLPPHRDCWNDNPFLVYSYTLFGGGTFLIYLLVPRRLFTFFSFESWNNVLDSTIRNAVLWLISFVVFCGLQHLPDIFNTLYGGGWFYVSAILKILMFIASVGCLYYFDNYLVDYLKKMPSYTDFFSMKRKIDSFIEEKQSILKSVKEIQQQLLTKQTQATIEQINKKLEELNTSLSKYEL